MVNKKENQEKQPKTSVYELLSMKFCVYAPYQKQNLMDKTVLVTL